MSEALAWLIPGLPFASFLLIGLVVRPFLNRRADLAGYLTVLAVGGALGLSLVALRATIAHGGPVGWPDHPWVVVGDLAVRVGLLLDPLAAVMVVVVSGVSLAVQVYSLGYMKGDPGLARYFAYMSLFTAAMLGLVLASNLILLYVFWEVVGLCSYLLIGFWYHRPAAAAAAKKAFLVTRIGDVGFLLALLYLFSQRGAFAAHGLDPFNIGHLYQAVATGVLPGSALTWVGLGLLAGAVGKSAQFPLHVWLPDAMEGPTPVSALIHAATMVAAGVYLVARLFPIYALSEEASTTVAVIGAVTAVMAGLLGLVMTDIKRVLAYSTISQLGYMMAGLGALGFAPAIFHLFTHAFFKALLFLGAGSVNHATGTFDMRKMGGLARPMPVTFATTAVAALALVGIFPLAGFWSKDELLAVAWETRPQVFWALLVGVFLTALYMGRLLFLTFGGQYRGGEAGGHGHHGPHESPPVMILPMVALAALAVTVGLVNLGKGLEELLLGSLPQEGLAAEPQFRPGIAAASVAIGVGGLVVAWAIYGLGLVKTETVRRALWPLPLVLERKFFLDDLYEGAVARGLVLQGVARGLHLWDQRVVDGLANGVAAFLRAAAHRLRLVQVGQAQVYGAAIALGAIVAVVVILMSNP